MGKSAPDIVAGGLYGFPPTLTSFIGRASAVTEVAGLLDEYRLVTVTGPGGAGKTRLAGEVARRMAGRFADGVWLAELAAVRDPALVPAAVAAALGVRDLPGVKTTEALTRVLSQRQLLLVLDNCEHVIGAAAGLCAGLLPAADDVRVLATSRESLRVAGETSYRLAPLALPDPDAGPADAEDLAAYEAVALFADRARGADAHFALTSETGSAVARLVTRLDGMPLAIELAAARVEALGVAQLLDRLDDRFDLLTSGDRLATGRQRSLAATVQWSYRLLGERERRVFRAVSVFSGPFTLEAAEAVAGTGAEPGVLRLVDCSLLSPPRAGPDGRSRYGMLETLRAYGARLLADAGEQDEAAAALAGYALGVAEEAAAGLGTGTEEVTAARRLDAEDAMMRQVLAWAIEHDTVMAQRLAVALAPWWFLRGRLAGQDTLLRAIARHAVPGAGAWCAMKFWLGAAAMYSGDLTEAVSHFTAVCNLIGDRRPSRALADCLVGRTWALANMGRIPEAVDEGRRALALARELDYPACEALALERLGITAIMARDLDRAVELARQARQIPADIPGWIARLCGSFLATVLIWAGELTGVERDCAAGLAQSREAGDLWNQAKLLVLMANLNVQAGRLEDAAAYLREALQMNARTSGRFELQNNLNPCGYLCAANGRFTEAVTIWAACDAIFRYEGYPVVPMEWRHRHKALREARQALGPARTRVAEDRGAAMNLDTAVEYALMLTAPGLQQLQAEPAAQKLSARERELVTLVAQGFTNAQIAAQLFISVRTVGSHLDRIRDKTGCRRRVDLTRLALSSGLV